MKLESRELKKNIYMKLESRELKSKKKKSQIAIFGYG
jgi:hypothetical protein